MKTPFLLPAALLVAALCAGCQGTLVSAYRPSAEAAARPALASPAEPVRLIVTHHLDPEEEVGSLKAEGYQVVGTSRLWISDMTSDVDEVEEARKLAAKVGASVVVLDTVDYAPERFGSQAEDMTLSKTKIVAVFLRRAG